MPWRSMNAGPENCENKFHFFSPLAVALQGGGAYGAFAWGALDRLLEDPDFRISALSGSSAGAVNAVVAAWGLMEGGNEGARSALQRLWSTVGQYSMLSPMAIPGLDLPFDLMTRLLSPYQFNPLNLNPLRDVVAGIVDFERLRRESPVPLFIAATNVSTGDQRIFREGELTVDVLMASACIPYIHHAVEIEGQSYWDGGFSANPPILPMVLETPCRSLLLVKLTPDAEPGRPTAAPEIFARLKRILVNAPLLRELDAIEEMQRALRRTNLLPSDLRRLRDLSIGQATIGHAFFGPGGASALNPHPELLSRLHEAGRATAENMLGDRAGEAAGSARG